MSAQADIPSGLTDTDKASIYQLCDADFNSMILGVLLHGMYTGILAVTLWNIFINKCWRIRRGLVVLIIFLHALVTFGVAVEWLSVRSAFVENGKSFWTVSLYIQNEGQTIFFVGVIASAMSTILTDSYMIWCCWMVWGRRWPIVLLPVLSLISATVFKILETYAANYIYYISMPILLFPTLYAAFILATTLLCTILIIYRILTVTGVKRGAGGQLRVYHRCIEVLVESSALYSISLIVYMALNIRHNVGLLYLEVIAVIAKGVAPTLIIGQAAAGHTRPNDDYDESTVSSLHFQAPSEVGTTSFQESTIENTILETDIEAQQQQSDELVVVVERA
ncbi:uncharacterized protein ARMOST_14718 [Armillaria ostoyae]|uniref:Integral membrane protein n=1 Tax=Armillaria ostoyae TaxID=47428 RepID=A0A284RRK2_ARMOS|nr:uncharacterized protein ARMOST_14718 [Armillaria ostoyae]